MSTAPQYMHLVSGAIPPPIACRPTRVLVVLDCPVDPDWQDLVSRWLVDSGCLYMLAWGEGCGSWDDSVDFASLESFGYGEIPDTSLVMTTWHEQESFAEFLQFAKHSAQHPEGALERTLILHIGPVPRESQVVRAYVEV